MRRTQLPILAALYALVMLPGCNKGGGSGDARKAGVDAPLPPVARVLHGVTINEQAILDDPPRPMTAARNETASTVLQLSNIPKAAATSVLTLRFQPLQLQ